MAEDLQNGGMRKGDKENLFFRCQFCGYDAFLSNSFASSGSSYVSRRCRWKLGWFGDDFECSVNYKSGLSGRERGENGIIVTYRFS